MEKKDNLLIREFMSSGDDAFIINENGEVSYNVDFITEVFTKINEMGYEVATLRNLSGVYDKEKGLNITNIGEDHELKTIIEFVKWYND